MSAEMGNSLIDLLHIFSYVLDSLEKVGNILGESINITITVVEKGYADSTCM
jgi:hypothetical protein